MSGGSRAQPDAGVPAGVRHHMPKTLRLRAAVVSAFKAACQERARSPAAVLSTLLEEYLALSRPARTRLHADAGDRLLPETAKRGGGVPYSCRLPPELLDRLEKEAEEDGRSSLNIIEWLMAFWSLSDGDGTLSSAVPS